MPLSDTTRKEFLECHAERKEVRPLVNGYVIFDIYVSLVYFDLLILWDA